jgi:threonine/homoserine/homoserine lactone efflux protein
MDLLLLGLGMGIVGGMIPSPLHFIALTQVASGRRLRASVLLVGPPMLVDGFFLVITFFFYQYIPLSIAHYTAYAGGVALAAFGGISLWKTPRKNPEGKAHSWALTYSSVSLATLVEATAPGTWVYWLTIAGPIIAEGRREGYWQVVPFFAGSLAGYYGAAFLSVWLMAWGAQLHKEFNRYLFRIANILLVVLGILYFARSYFER